MDQINKKSSGKLIGVILIAAAVLGLYWGETNSAKKKDSFKAVASKVVSVSSDSISSENEGKLIHTSGQLTTEDILSDKEFGISQSALKLTREVEMYQWEEKEESSVNDEEKTYKYEKVWSDDLINSDKFENKWLHGNPNSIPFEGKSYVAKSTKLGGFNISSDYMNQISATEEVEIKDESNSQIRNLLGWNQKFTLIDNKIFIGNDPTSPNIGDVKVSFYVARPDDFSIMGQQTGDTISSYYENETKIAILNKGIVGSSEMIDRKINQTAQSLWIIRGIASIAGLFGLVILSGKAKMGSTKVSSV